MAASHCGEQRFGRERLGQERDGVVASALDDLLGVARNQEKRGGRAGSRGAGSPIPGRAMPGMTTSVSSRSMCSVIDSAARIAVRPDLPRGDFETRSGEHSLGDIAKAGLVFDSRNATRALPRRGRGRGRVCRIARHSGFPHDHREVRCGTWCRGRARSPTMTEPSDCLMMAVVVARPGRFRGPRPSGGRTARRCGLGFRHPCPAPCR